MRELTSYDKMHINNLTTFAGRFLVYFILSVFISFVAGMPFNYVAAVFAILFLHKLTWNTHFDLYDVHLPPLERCYPGERCSSMAEVIERITDLKPDGVVSIQAIKDTETNELGVRLNYLDGQHQDIFPSHYPEKDATQ